MTTHAIPVRLDLDRYATGFGRAMAHLDKAATKELDAANIDPLLRELIRVRASQINGCAYCVDMHTRDARAAGETEQRLHAVAVWKEAPFFTDRERAALAFTESVTRLASTRAVPTSQGLGITSGEPGRCSSRKVVTPRILAPRAPRTGTRPTARSRR